MRSISSQTLSLLNGKIAIDPVFIIGVEWREGNPKIFYADREIEGMEDVRPQIIKMGELDCSQTADSQGQTNSISVVLSDVEGDLKSIFDQNDIHKRLVFVYQYFMGTSTGDKFLLFAGQISTPLVWDEGERTLSFDVVTKIEDLEIGFSAEMGRYQSLSHKLIGQPWPMVFGTVLHVPGLQLQEIPAAFTLEPFSIPDQSLIAEIQKLSQQIADFPKYNVAQICGNDLVAQDTDCEQEDANEAAFQAGRALQAQLDQLQEQRNELQDTLNQQRIWQRSRVNLIPTMQVLQTYTGILKVGSGLFSGHIDNTGGYLITTPLLEPGNYDIQKQLIKAGYQFYNAGSQVSIVGQYEIVFVVSIVPGTVTEVYAFYSFRGLRQLVKVPEEYYTIETRDYGVEALCVVLRQPLSTTAFLYNLGIQNWENNFGQYLPPHLVATVDWEDQVYATVVSDIGPNPVDIMIYVIDNYTTCSYDADNFAEVRTKVASTPMNFVFQSRTNSLEFLSELAYQARCAIYLVEDVFHLKFLPESGEEVDSINESDVEVGTLKVTTTVTESLVTIYEATFRPDYSPTFEEPVRAIFRFNVNKYGYKRETHDFFAFNSFDVVEKVATFWMIRKSMTWKLLQCRLHLNKLNLEVFDTVLLDFGRPYIANSSVRGMVTNARYSPDNQTIEAEFWTPVRLGEMEPYQNAWDLGIEVIEIFPTYRDIQAGSAGGVGGGEKRELPPANGILLDIQLNKRENFTRGDPTPLRGYGANDDLAPVIPSNLGLHVPIPGGNPGLSNYHYPKDREPAKVPEREWSAVYPGVVQEFLRLDTNGKQLYTVDVFRKGLSGAGRTTAAWQLQIDQDDRIPVGSSCFIIENTYQLANPTEGTNGLITERTIQIPIWLR